MLDKLEPRERMLLFGGVALVLTVLLFFGGARVREMRQRVSEDVADKREAVQTMQRLSGAISSMKPPQALPSKSQFFANVTNLLSQYNLKGSGVNQKEQSAPGRTIYQVSMTMRAVRMEDLLRYLHAIEYERRVPANIDRIRVNRAVSGREVYDVNLTVSISLPAE